MVAKLRSKLSNADVANLQSVSEVNDLKTQIISIVPRNIVNRILKENYKVKVENVNAESMENVAVISAVSALVQQYEQSEKQNIRLRQDFEIKLNELQRLLDQNQTDFESISEFISRDPAFNRNLNDERFQNLKQQCDEMSSKYSALKTTKIKEMESIADQAVKSEMSKLNTQLDELNSLFVKYNRKAQDIFEWKTSMLKGTKRWREQQRPAFNQTSNRITKCIIVFIFVILQQSQHVHVAIFAVFDSYVNSYFD